MKNLIVAGVLSMFLAGAAIVFAQPYGPGCREGGRGPGAGMMYDASKEITVTGDVTAVEQIASRGRMQKGQGVVLTLKTADGTEGEILPGMQPFGIFLIFTHLSLSIVLLVPF